MCRCKAQRVAAAPDRPPAGPGSLFWALLTLPVPAGGTGKVKRGQSRHPDSVAAHAEALENSGGG